MDKYGQNKKFIFKFNKNLQKSYSSDLKWGHTYLEDALVKETHADTRHRIVLFSV